MEGSGCCCGVPFGVLLLLFGAIYRSIAKDFQRSAIDTRAQRVTPICRAEPGKLVAVEGVVEAHEQVASPITDARGVMVYWQVVGASGYDHYGVDRVSSVLASELICQAFAVRDETGRVEVEPWDAKFTIAAEETSVSVPVHSEPENELSEKIRTLVPEPSALDGWSAITYYERVVLPEHPIFLAGVAERDVTAGGGYRDAGRLVFRHDEERPLRIHTSTQERVVKQKQALSREVWRVAVGFWVVGALLIVVPLLWAFYQSLP